MDTGFQPIFDNLYIIWYIPKDFCNGWSGLFVSHMTVSNWAFDHNIDEIFCVFQQISFQFHVLFLAVQPHSWKTGSQNRTENVAFVYAIFSSLSFIQEGEIICSKFVIGNVGLIFSWDLAWVYLSFSCSLLLLVALASSLHTCTAHSED